MIEQVNGFITPMKEWDAVGKNDAKITGTENGTKSVFQSVLEDTIQNVYDTQKDVEQKQYLLATGQLEDAHSLPIAQAKAELSVEVMIWIHWASCCVIVIYASPLYSVTIQYLHSYEQKSIPDQLR